MEDASLRLTFSLPHPTIQLQQNRCPHSVAQLSVLSSRQSVQFLDALRLSGIEETSSIVLSSSSAGFAGSPSGLTGPRRVDTGRSSRKVSRVSDVDLAGCFPSETVDFEECRARRKTINRCSSRTPSKMPSNEYDGGLV